MEGIKMQTFEEKAPEITIHPEGYDHCACCPNCFWRDKCSCGEFGDFGICHGYKDDGSSGK